MAERRLYKVPSCFNTQYEYKVQSTLKPNDFSVKREVLVCIYLQYYLKVQE